VAQGSGKTLSKSPYVLRSQILMMVAAVMGTIDDKHGWKKS